MTKDKTFTKSKKSFPQLEPIRASGFLIEKDLIIIAGHEQPIALALYGHDLERLYAVVYTKYKCYIDSKRAIPWWQKKEYEKSINSLNRKVEALLSPPTKRDKKEHHGRNPKNPTRRT